MRKSTRYFISAGVSLASPVVTWRCSDWYVRTLGEMMDQLRWGDGARLTAVCALIATVGALLLIGLFERENGQ